MIKTATYDKSLKAFLHKELKGYVRSAGCMTEGEKNGLHEWVASGNSVYDNPYYYSDDCGQPMDYISAVRVNDEMLAEKMGS